MANNDNDSASIIRLLTKKPTQERAQHPDFVREMFERLAKVDQPYFNGKVDPTFLDNWIREFEKIFGALNCPESIKVGLVVMYLKDEADLCWKENGARLSAIEGFNWDYLVIALRRNFYPAFIRKQKA